MNIKELFGKNVKKLRNSHGLSQEDLADISGLHRTYIGSIERGERNVTIMNAERIAQALKIPLTELLKDEE